MVEYVVKMVLGGLATGGIFGGVIMLIIGTIIRWNALKMHLATAALYRSDYEKQGFISGKTVLRGMTIHALWNLGASLISILTSALAILGLFLTVTSVQIGVSAVVRYVGKQLGIPKPEPQEEPEFTLKPQVAYA